jgi:hypothetical protein
MLFAKTRFKHDILLYIQREALMHKGILVAVDSYSEWLLAGWWATYSQYNNYPVCFVNLGMSKKSLVWAQEKGMVIQPSIIGGKALTKPLILQLSPFQETIWIELNCEVCGPLAGLFEELTEDQEIGLSFEKNDKGMMVNSSVVVFKQNTVLLTRWVEKSLKNHPLSQQDHYFFQSIFEIDPAHLKELNPIYNWGPTWGSNPSAIILRWPIKTRKLFIDSFPIKMKTF